MWMMRNGVWFVIKHIVVAVESTYQWLTPCTKQIINVPPYTQACSQDALTYSPRSPHTMMSPVTLVKQPSNSLLGSSGLATTAPPIRFVSMNECVFRQAVLLYRVISHCFINTSHLCHVNTVV